MSKQSTLFKAWGGSCKPPPSSSAQAGDGEYGFNDVALLDDFFHDDITDELCSANPSTFLNSSVIEDIPGFDTPSGQLWIYPINYPLRDYQFNIVQKALFKNTLVCLPTGLGKTFIAAVVMFNFYRWYPSGKVLFLAPTKPLVAQQIEACYNVMGIPQCHAAEMTGNLPPKDRLQMWRDKRVFFLTPQVLQNDLARGACPAHDICCVVFDEAHKALGNHAYCQVVKELTSAGSQFRVLALSATPGNDLKAVQQVVTNIQIGHIELRSEDSFDIQQYVHQRKVEKVVVPLDGEIFEAKNTFLKVLSNLVNRLSKHKLLYHSNAEKMSKFQILQARDRFRQGGGVPPPGTTTGAIEGDFALCISLYHAYELLELHGMRSFYNFLKQSFSGANSRTKMEVMRNRDFNRVMTTLAEKLGPGSETDASRGTLYSPRTTPIGVPFFYSHPKLCKLEGVVLDHFQSFQEQSSSTSTGSVSTRVMIFSQYRESVQEIADMLAQHAPLVRVMSFVGHGNTGKSGSKGLSQKEQTEVVKRFRTGGYNTLVATCVGEEGLDIGEVDLIVCFDAHKSPIRLVQRMGRTGRKRSGRIVVIVAQGKEEQIYLKSQSNKTSIHRAIREGCKSLHFFPDSPRMVPRHIHPQAHKMHMNIGEYVTSSKAGGRKGKTSTKLKSVQPKINFATGSKRGYLTDAELAHWNEQFALSDRDSKAVEKAVDKCLSRNSPFTSITKLKSKDSASQITSPSTSLNSSMLQGKYSLSLDRWIHWQTAPLPHKVVGHSTVTNHLKSTLEFMDVLNAGDDMGLSYELEMQSFLNPDDVKMRGELRKRRNDSPLECSEDQEIISGKNSRKRRRIFDDDDFSGDEDFKSAIVTSANQNNPPEIPREPETPQSRNSDSGKEEPDNVAGAELTALDTPVVNCKDSLAPSQHAIPRAPSPNSLDWIDFMQPSQVSTPKYSRCNDTPPISTTRKFEFVSPKVPPTSSRKRQAHTLSVSVRSPSPPSHYHSSMDLFGDIPSSELLADFSDAGMDLGECKPQKSPIGKPKGEQNCQVHQRPTLSVPPTEIERCLNTPTRSPTLSVVPNKRSVPSSKDPASPSKTEVQLDLDISVIEESDLEDPDEVVTDNHSDPREAIICGTSDDSFIQMHGKRSRKRAEFLQSPPFSAAKRSDGFSEAQTRTAIASDSKENAAALMNRRDEPGSSVQGNMRAKAPKRKPPITDSSDDEFEVPLHTRLKRKKGLDLPHRESKSGNITTTSRRDKETRKAKGFSSRERQGYIEEEAELSDDAHDSADETEQDSNAYDSEDSFINDASMLTQLSPTQAPQHSNKGFKSPANMGDVYRRSLMSPDTLFAGKRRGCGNHYRMVFSQRHQLLNHYINKAGFRVASGAKRKLRKKLVSPESFVSESDDRHLFDTDNYSEAEEVHVPYGEEELEEVATSQSFEELPDGGEVGEDESELHCAPAPSRKRRAVLFSGSDMDTSFNRQQEEKEVSCGENRDKKLRPSSSPSEVAAGQVSGSKTKAEDKPVLDEPLVDGVISPCLLANIVVRSTPACYSLGLDDLLSDGEEEGGGENPLQAEKPPSVEDIDTSFTQKDIEMNFDLDIDCFSDTDIIADSPGCSKDMTKHSAPIPPNPTMTDARQPSSYPLPINTSPARSACTSICTSQHSMGTILASSREIAHSQVVSTLRYKHHIDVHLCRLGHSGYIVSNRMVVERRLQSDFTTSSSGGKILSKLQEMKELFDRVCLILEKDPVKEKPLPKPGNYLEYALARLMTSNITVLFSQSQESTASLLAKLVETEGKKGQAILIPEGLQDEAEPVLNMLMKVPRLNYITALNMCASFKTLHDLMQCSLEDLRRRVPSLHLRKAQEICGFFAHKYNPNLVG